MAGFYQRREWYLIGAWTVYRRWSGMGEPEEIESSHEQRGNHSPTDKVNSFCLSLVKATANLAPTQHVC